MGEWLEQYARYIAGEEVPQPPLRYQYLDYADWQRHQSAAGALEENLAYSEGPARGPSSGPAASTDRPRPPVQTYVGARASATLSERRRDESKSLHDVKAPRSSWC